MQSSTTNAAASPSLYWRCLQATLMFEAHLMEIRKACFDKDKSCTNLHFCDLDRLWFCDAMTEHLVVQPRTLPGKDVKTLRQRLGRVSVACKQLRIPEEHLQQAISAMDGGQCTFGDLLRSVPARRHRTRCCANVGISNCCIVNCINGCIGTCVRTMTFTTSWSRNSAEPTYLVGHQ